MGKTDTDMKTNKKEKQKEKRNTNQSIEEHMILEKNTTQA